jgi:tRNA pseudouridine synthase 10
MEISGPFIQATQATDSSFHGAGREDIDALMLGKGRPFVLELKDPKKRTIDLVGLSNKVNQSSKVQIKDIQYTDKDMIAFLKQGSSNAWKVYRADVETNTEITDEQIKVLNQWGQTQHQLEQRTPQRVSHRRANKLRRKKIYSVTAKRMGKCLLELEIHAQGGAYIKEFISSDEGRTEPSIAALLDTNALCTALDVIAVDDRGVFGGDISNSSV